MPVKDIVIQFLMEKQNQIIEQYTEWEDLQVEFPEDCGLCQAEMDRIDCICDKIRREIYELEGLNVE